MGSLLLKTVSLISFLKRGPPRRPFKRSEALLKLGLVTQQPRRMGAPRPPQRRGGPP